MLQLQACDISFDNLFNYDNKCFITSGNPVRKEFLKKWICIPGGATFAALDSQGTLIGFGCRRPCMEENYHMIGPLYADTKEVAQALLQELCKGIAGQMFCLHTWLVPYLILRFMVEHLYWDILCDLIYINQYGTILG